MDWEEVIICWRVQLVQTVLFGVQAYWAQLFVLPAKVLKTIDAYCRSYIWSGCNTISKKALASWERVCAPKSVGGLGLANLKVWNKAAIAKNYWDLAHKQDKLWIKWIHAYYIKGQEIETMTIPLNACWMLRKIMEARSVFEAIQWRFKNGKSITRQIYIQLIGEETGVPWKSMMFGNAARPKARFTLWLQLQGRLLTTDTLAKWGLVTATQCVMCTKVEETHEHLFLECIFAKEVWQRVNQWTHGQSMTTGG